MPMEPITVYSRYIEPIAVLQRLLEFDPHAEVDGSQGVWRRATLKFMHHGAPAKLMFIHDPADYAEPDWSMQMENLQQFFARFPSSPRKDTVISLVSTLKFSLGTLFEPDFDPEGDPRLEVLFNVAEMLDAVLFSYSTLRDASGRVLLSVYGPDSEDPDALFPHVVAPGQEPDPSTLPPPNPTPRQPGEEPDFDPPMPMRVAVRALALAAVTGRAMLEQDLANPDAEPTYRDLLAWGDALGIESELEPEERAILVTPLGQLDPALQLKSTWRLEGLAVLAWALNRFQLPSHDQIADVNTLWRNLGLLDIPAAGELLAQPVLRRRAELASLRDQLFAIHWRLTDFEAQKTTLDFAEFLLSNKFGPPDLGGLSLVDNDLALGGVRIDQAPADLFQNCQNIAQERHRAANWLWEGPARYSEASITT